MKTKLFSLIFIILCGCLPLVAQEDLTEQPVMGKVIQDKDGIYLSAEKMPSFPGGMQALMKFLRTNIKYPVEAQQKKIMGRVIIQFVVMEDGRLTMERVVRGVDPLLDAEALRVVKLMPKWEPAMQNEKPVKVRFTIPVMFNLSGGNSAKPPHGFQVPMQAEIKNKTLEGVWQSCRVEPGNKNYHVTLASILKILSADKTFMNLFTGDGKVCAAILAQGSYKKTSDNTYVESLEKSVITPFVKGTKNEITFEFLTDNLVKFTFMVPGREEPWVEYWFRVPMPEGSVSVGATPV